MRLWRLEINVLKLDVKNTETDLWVFTEYHNTWTSPFIE